MAVFNAFPSRTCTSTSLLRGTVCCSITWNLSPSHTAPSKKYDKRHILPVLAWPNPRRINSFAACPSGTFSCHLGNLATGREQMETEKPRDHGGQWMGQGRHQDPIIPVIETEPQLPAYPCQGPLDLVCHPEYELNPTKGTEPMWREAENSSAKPLSQGNTSNEMITLNGENCNKR